VTGVRRPPPGAADGAVRLRQGPHEWALLAALVALWGSPFVLIHLALQAFPPLALTAGRLLIGGGVLALFVLFMRRRLPLDWRAWRFFAAMAVIGNALPFFLIAWGQREIPSGLAGIFMAATAPVVLVLAHFLVPGERLTPRRSGGFLLGLAGVVLLTGPEALDAIAAGVDGLAARLAVLGGTLCYAVAIILARRGPHLEPLVTSACVLLLGGVLCAALLPWLPGPALPPGLPGGPVLALLALGVLSTGLAAVIYFRLVARAGASFLSLTNYLVPPWAVVAGALLLGERLPLRAFVALGLILGGIVVAQFRGQAGALPP
jgi:drug/metabolite transporter (DMT)-like permease